MCVRTFLLLIVTFLATGPLQAQNITTLIAEIRTIYDNYDFDTEILAASIRTVNHVKQAALIGADVATVPPATLKALVKHPLTDKGLEAFLADWAKTGQKIG